MSEITDALFRNLHLPLPRPNPDGTPGVGIAVADTSGEARRVAGQVDQVFSDMQDEYVSATEAYEYAFRQGAESGPRTALRLAGLEDPFQITPEVEASAAELVERHQPQNEMETAILFMQALIPDYASFSIPENPNDIPALSMEEGNLGIIPNDDVEDPIRSGGSELSGTNTGNLTPDELLALPPGRRIARCLEYAFLLTGLLRSQGIEAGIVREPHHAYVVATIDGVNYRIDPAQGIFERTDASPLSERQAIAMHYYNEGEALIEQGRLSEAVEVLTTATELDPNYAPSWQALGLALERTGVDGDRIIDATVVDQALYCYASALELDDRNPSLLEDMTELFATRGRPIYDRVLRARSILVSSTRTEADSLFLASYPQAERTEELAFVTFFNRLLEDHPTFQAAVALYEAQQAE